MNDSVQYLSQESKVYNILLTVIRKVLLPKVGENKPEEELLGVICLRQMETETSTKLVLYKVLWTKNHLNIASKNKYTFMHLGN